MKLRKIHPMDLVEFIGECSYANTAYPLDPYHDGSRWFNARFVPIRDLEYKKENDHFKFQRRSAGWGNTERRVWAFCWHGHLKLFREIFEAFPEAQIHTALAKQVHGTRLSQSLYTSETFEKLFPATGEVNIGSQMMPVRADEACFCSQTGDDYWKPKVYQVTPKEGKTVRISTFPNPDLFPKAKSGLAASDGSKVRNVRQANLTGECWPVQVWGLSECEKCTIRDTEECGGATIRETLKNSLGKEVPVL